MTVYLDANVIVGAIVDDPFSTRVEAFLTTNKNVLITSNFAILEVASVIGRLFRMKAITRARAEAGFVGLDTWLAASVMRIDVEARDVSAADGVLRQLDLGLRGPDAIHIVVAERHQARLVTFDERMQRAARALGLGLAKI